MTILTRERCARPWAYLDVFIPPWYPPGPEAEREHFWLVLGSILLVWALDSYPALQTPLRSNFSRYLGEISFGIYITHTLVIAVLWENVLRPVHLVLGSGVWTYVILAMIHHAIVLWIGDLFTRVDDRVVQASKWLQDVLFISDDTWKNQKFLGDQHQNGSG
jgi:peptidoglycan/LPS O-acetylase OafA/YrhL